MATWRGPFFWQPSQPAAARPLTPALSAGSPAATSAATGTAATPGSSAAPERRAPARTSSAPGEAAAKEQSGRERATAVVAGSTASPAAPVAAAAPSTEVLRDRFWSATLREVTPEPAFAAPSAGSSTLPRERSTELFSPADLDVAPAALVRPQLPSLRTPSGPDQRDSVFDLIIDQNGRVEQVHLVSPTNRFNDRMLIAAAKAWQFLPATRDGQPVRYKLQLRIAP
jgi:hypothetical protein